MNGKNKFNQKIFVDVYFWDGSRKQKIGTLAEGSNRRVYFEYDSVWIHDGFSISPFSLPLEKKVYVPESEPFGGIHGVFNDSLPDGWGALLVDRMLRKNGISLSEIGFIDRLAIVGANGAGALVYEPQYEINLAEKISDLDFLSKECQKILEEKLFDENLDVIFKMGGSSGGARPKVFFEIDGEEWIVKFPSHIDKKDCGLMEYEYSLCAKKCGINMAETKLLDSKICSGFFATKRFDRIKNGENTKRIHTVSASGILESSHRFPSLDYEDLLKVTSYLTKDNSEVEQMFRLGMFNVISHNQDDHAKNFSFLYDAEKRAWKMAPAYDLTFSTSFGNEQSTTVNGKGKNITLDDFIILAKKFDLSENRIKVIYEEIESNVHEMLRDWIKK